MLHDWESVLDMARERLLRADAAMVAAYKARIPASRPDPRALYQPGDLVLMKHKQPGKHKVRAVGPFKFLEYTGRRDVVVRIRRDGE